MGYSLVLDKTTDYGNGYSGPAEVATITFNTGPEQLSFIDSWLKNNIVSDARHAVEKEGGRVLRVQLYRDKSPVFVTKWKLLITACKPASLGQQANLGAVPLLAWAVIVGAILLVSWAVSKVLQGVSEIIWGPGGDGGTPPPLGIPWLGWIGIGLVVIWGMGKHKRGEI